MKAATLPQSPSTRRSLDKIRSAVKRLSGYQQSIISVIAGGGSLLAAIFVGIAVNWHGPLCLDGGRPANPGPNLAPLAGFVLLAVAITGIAFAMRALGRRREDPRAYGPAVTGLVLSIMGVTCFWPAACLIGVTSAPAQQCI